MEQRFGRWAVSLMSTRDVTRQLIEHERRLKETLLRAAKSGIPRERAFWLGYAYSCQESIVVVTHGGSPGGLVHRASRFVCYRGM
jgi:hypothetical protein